MEIVALIPILILILLVCGLALAGVRRLGADERGVIFRMGRVLPRPREPGLLFLIPGLDRMVKVDARPRSVEAGDQNVPTADRGLIRAKLQIEYTVTDPVKSVVEVEDLAAAVGGLGGSCLREISANTSTERLLDYRKDLERDLQQAVTYNIQPFGARVSRVEVSELEEQPRPV